MQLLTQVSGRGPRGYASEVLIQTRQPDHPLMQQLDQPYDTALLPACTTAMRGLHPMVPWR